MKKRLFILILLIAQLICGQKINVKDFSAKGDGITDDTRAFLKAFDYAKRTYSEKRQNALIYIPAGTYILSKTLSLDKFISLTGEFVNTTILKTNSTDIPLLLLEKNYAEADIYNSYNYINNITIQGPDASNSFVGAKKKQSSGINSTGIWIRGLRTRLSNLQIEGFYTSALSVDGAYYTFIDKVLLKNNAVGLHITNTATSVYFTQNEVRFNSIGILVDNNSFANFINNNMIESNVATYYDADSSLNQINTQSTGRGIVICKSSANIISNNYFENHFVNITLQDANKNVLVDNFYAIGSNMITDDKNQVSLQLIGTSKENIFEKNTFLTSETGLKPNKIIIGNNDYSTNKIDVGNDNENLKKFLNQQKKDLARQPKIGD